MKTKNCETFEHPDTFEQIQISFKKVYKLLGVAQTFGEAGTGLENTRASRKKAVGKRRLPVGGW